MALARAGGVQPLIDHLRDERVLTQEQAAAWADVYVENELGYKARALLEIGFESALYAIDPERRARERAEAEAAAARAKAAEEAAMRRAAKEGLPWWSPDKYTP